MALPASAAKRARHLIRDAQLAIMVGLIPLLGLIYVLRLVQYYQFRNRHPGFAASGSGFAAKFRGALPRLSFAVLFWPGVAMLIVLYGLTI